MNSIAHTVTVGNLLREEQYTVYFIPYTASFEEQRNLMYTVFYQYNVIERRSCIHLS